MTKINICFIGIGGVGGYFGGSIVQNIMEYHLSDQYTTFFISRDQNFQEIKENGLLFESNGSMLKCVPDIILDNIADLPMVMDICFICCKSYGLEDILPLLKEKTHENTIIIALMNGIENDLTIRKTIKRGFILPACIYVTSHLLSPGHIRHNGPKGKIILGNDRHRELPTPNILSNLLSVCNISYEWSANPQIDIWKKYMLIASFGLISAFYDKTMGEICDDTIMLQEVKDIMYEIVSIAHKKGIGLHVNEIEQSCELVKQYPYNTKTSFQLDIEKKKQCESDIFALKIIQLGMETDVLTPITSRIYHSLQQREPSGIV